MIILGLDPGTATTGFGVIQIKEINDELALLDYGCIITKSNIPLATRLTQLSQDLEKIITYWKPENIAVEELFFSKNVKTAMQVSHARGAILEKLSSKNLSIYEYKPQHIKEAVCGHGRAEKIQVQKMVQLILKMNELPRPDDAADALGAAICHAHRLKFQNLISS